MTDAQKIAYLLGAIHGVRGCSSSDVIKALLNDAIKHIGG